MEKPSGAMRLDQRAIGLGQLLVGILALIVSVVAVIVALTKKIETVQVAVRDVGDSVERLERNVLAQQFVVTSPVDGASVDLTELVRGRTPFPEMNHYIVVTPVAIGDDWVQDGPVKGFAGASWGGRARFGTAGAGAGERFVVRGLATRSTVPPGPLIEVPENAIFSESITVIRRK